MPTHIMLFLCVSFLLNSIHVLCGETDSLLLDCGSVDGGATDLYNRKWISDSQFIKTKPSISRAAFQDPLVQSQIPYTKTRIFTKEGTYLFPVRQNTHYLIRLHFYPTSYGNYNSADSFFSVKANAFTLLKNFSASITCQALSQTYMVREYYLAPLNVEQLSLSFKARDGSFAFVNGIEVIKMPNLFTSAATMIGSNSYINISHLYFQTMFRLNVGGRSIMPNEDSGLTREWTEDTKFLAGSVGRTNFGAQSSILMKGFPHFIAPREVYLSARYMSSNKALAVSFNLSWSFPVDPNSTYCIRLHFCDLYCSKPNQVVFKIFINNQLAEASADVIQWSGGQRKPTYEDYLVYFSDVAGDQKLWVSLHPSTESKPQFFDVMLNGLEIFKISDTNGTLAGVNPMPSTKILEEEDVMPQSRFKKSKRPYVKVIGGAVAAISIVAALCVIVRVYQRNSFNSKGQPMSENINKISAVAQGLCRQFSLSEIQIATKQFDASNVIGVGGFGNVYKGILAGGTKVAIKRANPSSDQGMKEFKTEIELLSKLKHKHLVTLLGFCDEDKEMILVYEYMPRGNLKQHLNNTEQPFSWKRRIKICVGAARGLHYLHTSARYIHRDVKTTNILLDKKWVPKLADFGLSKTGPILDETHVTTMVKGSFGYLDPEYIKLHQLTEKSDIYSLGVVLCEVLCARAALNQSLPKEQVSLAEWVLKCKSNGSLVNIIDSNIKGNIHPECLNKFADTAEKCLAEVGHERPSIADVLRELEVILKIQTSLDNEASDESEEGVII